MQGFSQLTRTPRDFRVEMGHVEGFSRQIEERLSRRAQSLGQPRRCTLARISGRRLISQPFEAVPRLRGMRRYSSALIDAKCSAIGFCGSGPQPSALGRNSAIATGAACLMVESADPVMTARATSTPRNSPCPTGLPQCSAAPNTQPGPN